MLCARDPVPACTQAAAGDYLYGWPVGCKLNQAGPGGVGAVGTTVARLGSCGASAVRADRRRAVSGDVWCQG